jgi:hypothetical protein
MATETRRELDAFVKHLEGIRSARLEVWRELHKWVIPHRGRFPEDTDAAEASLELTGYNNAPLLSLRKGASGLTSAMTPSGLPWFRLAFAEDGLEEVTGARAWLDDVESKIGRALSSGGFYQAVHACNQELIGYGAMLLYSEQDGGAAEDGTWRDMIRFECIPVGSFCVALDAAGRLEAVARKILMSPRDMEKRFGREALSEESRLALEKEPYKSIEVTHVVRRRENRDKSRSDNRNMAFASWLYEKDGGSILRESGYTEMPYFYSTWTAGRTPYGYGPGDEALDEIRTLNAMEKKVLIGLDLTIDPPMREPTGFRGRLDTRPGGRNPMTYSERDGTAPLFEVNFMQGIAAVQQKIDRVEGRCDEILLGRVFADPFLEQLPKGVTATAIIAQRQQRAQMMGPAVSAYEPNVLSRVIFRVYSLLDAAGELPPLPAALEDMISMPRGLLSIEYISPLAQSLRRGGAESTQALVIDAMNIAAIRQDVLDKIDLDQAVDEMARGVGAPGSVVRSDADVAVIRQARAEAEQARMQQEQSMRLMDLATKAGPMSVGPGTLAGAVKDNMEEAADAPV